MSILPEIAILNNFYLGDSVLLEPGSTQLAKNLGYKVFHLSEYAELYKHHPYVEPKRFLFKDDACQVIDMTESLMSLQGKRDKILEDMGVVTDEMKPKLYLNAVELETAKIRRQAFDGPCIGIASGSRHHIKNWPYLSTLIKGLLNANCNVFVFGDKTDLRDENVMGLRVHKIMGKELRDMMQWVKAMDVMVGSDTGPMHVAASLGVPIVAIVLPNFTDLYQYYDNCKIITTNGYMRHGFKSVAALKIMNAIFEIMKPSPTRDKTRHCFVRTRGTGDVFLSLPALANLKAMNPKCHITYVTSSGNAKLLELSPVIDEVIAIDYGHAPAGKPILPFGVDYDSYDTVHNWINAIDFVSGSSQIPRTELFGHLLDFEALNYDTPWRITIPETWKQDAWILLKRNGYKSGKKLISFQVSSEGRSRMWPRERWIETAGKCLKKGWQPVLLSNRREKDIQSEIINLTGKTTMEMYASIIAVSDCFVGSDSSGIHIAGVTDTSAIGLFGAVNPMLRIEHYTSVKAIVPNLRCVPCNDWQFASCSNKAKNPECLWAIMPNRIIKEISKKLGVE